MTSVGQSAAGIMIASQNSGISSLVQQSVNVQSNLAVGASTSTAATAR
jgi:hypothetical protein